MYIQLSELKINPAKYFDLAKTVDVIVTRHGQRIGRIVCEKDAAKSDKKRAIEALVGSAVFPPEYNNPKYDPDYELLRDSAYKEKGLL